MIINRCKLQYNVNNGIIEQIYIILNILKYLCSSRKMSIKNRNNILIETHDFNTNYKNSVM